MGLVETYIVSLAFKSKFLFTQTEREDRLASLCSDTESATRYLTSKLVEDSLRWQREQSGRGIPWPPSGSPFGSPVRKRPQNLSIDPLTDGMRDGLSLVDRQEMLDPTAILVNLMFFQNYFFKSFCTKIPFCD